ncbi:hypothetical protein D3C85_444840 [compost metagenome]
MTIATQLTELNNIKLAIKAAIEGKGVSVGSAAYNTYAAKIASIATGGATGPTRPAQPANFTEGTWTRPADWLALPTITAGDTRLVGLFAVFDHGTNSVAIKCTGAYTVDWGDGTAPQDFASNVVAQHTFTFSSLGAGTLTSEGFRQAIIQVYPQGGATLTDITLNVRTTEQGAGTQHSSQWVDLHIASPTLTSLRLGSSTYPASSSSDTRAWAMRKLKLNCSAVTNLSYLCYAMYGLRDVEIIPASGLTSTLHMFDGCVALTNLTMTGTFALLTNTSYMFYDCIALRTLTLFDTSAVTNMSYMFYNCHAIQTVPLFNTANVTNMSHMFDACRSLVAIPAFNVVKVTDMSYMFYGCQNTVSITLSPCTAVVDTTSMFYVNYSLQKVELLGTTSALTTISRTFDSCRSLTEVTISNTIGVTNMNYVFVGCSTLPFGPELNTSNCTQMISMFDSCLCMVGIPAYDTSKVTRMDNMFSNCNALIAIPTLDTHLVTQMGSMFYGCMSLSSVQVIDAPLCLSMDAMFYNCMSLQTFEMISSPLCTTFYNMFNGCYGLKSAKMGTLTAATTFQNMFAACRTLQYVEIAAGTAVIYCIAMFSQCHALLSVPLFNTQNCTRMDNMFDSCYSLEKVPLFVTTNVTNMSSMFSGCRGLRALPTFDTAKVTNMDSMVSGCSALNTIPAWNVTACTSFVSFLTAGYSISRVLMTNIKFNISFNQQMLGWAELDELYSNLPTVTAKTLTINDNWGYQASNTAIATAKGWTLTDLYYATTKLLLHFNGTDGQTTTVDNSGTPKTVTAQGSGALSTAQPKFGTASAVSMASTTDGWTVADSADFQFGTNFQFTVEADVYYTTVPGGSDNACIIAQWGTNAQQSWFLGHIAGVFGFFYSTNGSDTLSLSAAWTPTVNTHYHVVAERDSSNVIRLYVNGVVLASTTSGVSLKDSTAVLQIGGGAGANSLVGMIGYIDEVRITKNTGRYAGAFRPPSAPYLNS